MINGIISECPLFTGIEKEKLNALLDCLRAVIRTYARDAFIFEAERRAEAVGVVLSGGVYVIQEDFWGNRAIIGHMGRSDLFGEAFSCAGVDKLPVSVIAAEKSEVMLIDYRKIVTTCSSSCVFHVQLIKNMLRVLAEKNIRLTSKMEHLSKRSTREKLLSFLSAQALRTNSGTVDIPFNRQELADYLCVDRSALSRELGLMRREGLLWYDKNHFKLLSGGS